jgi:hypothetical protein
MGQADEGHRGIGERAYRPFGIHGGQLGSFASRAWNTQLRS